MKTLGIIGGVGPDTTAEVYMSIINSIRKEGISNTYPPIVIYNLPFPYVIEREAIVEGKNSEKMIPYLIQGAQVLEKAGAEFGILPCNTLHKYIENIREAVSIPFLSILEETSAVLQKEKVKKVGVLGTKTTVESDIYGSALLQDGIEVVYPNEIDQKQVNQIIVAILEGDQSEVQNQILTAVSNHLISNGAEAVLLACTDLQLVARRMSITVPIHDTTEILTNAAIIKMM